MSNHEIRKKINSIIGKNIRAARNRRRPKIGARWLAHILQWKYKDFQGYEIGNDDISAADLWILSHALNRPVQDFYPQLHSDFMPDNLQARLNARAKLINSRFKESINIDAYVGNSITMLRQQKKVSRNELANKLGTSYSQMREYESGERGLPDDVLEEIASILGCVKRDFLPPGYYEK